MSPKHFGQGLQERDPPLQTPLFFQNLRQAMATAATFAGSEKEFLFELRPELSHDLEAAQRWFSDCTNPKRREHFGWDHLMRAMAYLRKRNCHILADFFGDLTGYKLVPVTPKSRRQHLIEQQIRKLEEAASLQAELDRLDDDSRAAG